MRSINQQGGFSLLIVVFLLLIVSGATALIANLATSSLTQTQRGYIGVQLSGLTKAGLEYGVNDVIEDNACWDPKVITWPAADGLSGYTSELECSWSAESHFVNNTGDCDITTQDCFALISAVSKTQLAGTWFQKTQSIELKVTRPVVTCPGGSQRPDGSCPGGSGNNGNGNSGGNSGNGGNNNNNDGGTAPDACPGGSQRPDGSCPGGSDNNGNGNSQGNSGAGNNP